MIECECLTNSKTYVKEYALTVQEFLKETNARTIKSVPSGKNNAPDYINDFITFDIETSIIDRKAENPQAFMYIWQMCVFGDYVVFGHTFKELQETYKHIKKLYNINRRNRAIIYVHNLAYEFQFIHQFVNTDYTNVFATDSHKVLYFTTRDGFEYRCSFFLTNMSLEKFTKKTPNVVHVKGVGDLDYKVLRTPLTILTPSEYGYCYNDVKGLYEALQVKTNIINGGNILAVPYTSTGYVRAEMRQAMNRPDMKKLLKKLKPTPYQYELLHEAYRGGNTASNRFLTSSIDEQMIHKNVGSWDITSSYPYVMIALPEFPMSKFLRVNKVTFRKVVEYSKTKCTLGTYYFSNLQLRNHKEPIPYISEHKCSRISKNAVVYNGRVLSADFVEMKLTNIDFLIVVSMYKFDMHEFDVTDFYIAEKGYLPSPVRDLVYKYFLNKTLYKKGDKYIYDTNKALLNGTYGMMVTAPDKLEYIINDKTGEWSQAELPCDKTGQIVSRETFLKDKLKEAYEGFNAYTAYQWGVWVSALARCRLQHMINIVGDDVVYCDTDSIKMLHPEKYRKEFENLNKRIIERAEKEGIKISAVEPKTGEVYYLGTWGDENEGREAEYTEFITMGAKKYAFTKPISDDTKVTYNGFEIGVTVAGLGKINGAKELAKGKGLVDFKANKVFYDSGRTTAKWNNIPIHNIVVDGCVIETASNIAILDTTYTLGMTDTMNDVIIEAKESIKTYE